MDQNKWELKSHSWQIADTGDYDGYWEITDGKTSICTKDDPNDERLEDIVKVLNATQCKFYTNNDTELNQQLEIYLLKDENAILRAKCDKMEQALKKARPWIEANTKCVAQDIAEMSLIDLRIIDEALEQPAEPTIPQQGAVTEDELIGFAEWAAELAYFDDEYRLWNFFEEGKMVDGQFRFTTKEFFALYKKVEGGEKGVTNG